MLLYVHRNRTNSYRDAQDNRLDFYTTQHSSSSSMLSYVHRETNNIKITQMENMVKPTCAMYAQWLQFATKYPNLRQKLFDWFMFNVALRPQKPYGLLQRRPGRPTSTFTQLLMQTEKIFKPTCAMCNIQILGGNCLIASSSVLLYVHRDRTDYYRHPGRPTSTFNTAPELYPEN